jgi:hypothetical protein
MKTTTIDLYVKDPDTFPDMAHELKLSAAVRRKYLEFGEYATIQLEVADDMSIVGGRFLPVKE